MNEKHEKYLKDLLDPETEKKSKQKTLELITSLVCQVVAYVLLLSISWKIALAVLLINWSINLEREKKQ